MTDLVLVPSDLVVVPRRAEHVQVAVPVHVRRKHAQRPLHARPQPLHPHHLHATVLYLMGIDHEKLTYKYSGRDFRLTDVAGSVIHDIIA